MAAKKTNYFTELDRVDVTQHIEKKGKFSYLSWAFAVRELKKRHPSATWIVHEYGIENTPYMKTECGFFVKVTVTVDGIDATQVHPVLDHNNKTVQAPNAFQINTAKQRCLTKCFGIYGLGHYIYANEDLPQDEVSTDNVKDTKQEVQKNDVDEDIGWANTFVKGFKNLVKTHKTRESVQNYYKSNGKSIKRLESINPDMLADIDNYCKEYIATLEEKNDG